MCDSLDNLANKVQTVLSKIQGVEDLGVLRKVEQTDLYMRCNTGHRP